MTGAPFRRASGRCVAGGGHHNRRARAWGRREEVRNSPACAVGYSPTQVACASFGCARGATIASAPSSRRDGRAVEGARLESVCRATYRGFESHSLRHSVCCCRDDCALRIGNGAIRAESRRLGRIGFRESTGDGALAGPLGRSQAEVLCCEFWRWTERFPQPRLMGGVGRRRLVDRLGLSLGANRPAAAAPPAPTMRAGSRSASRAHRR